ncbi:MAG: acetyl-CoA acetyltransferase [Deltaproteobacteria bacterium]|nr:acetyl-CoA acetyltransferase [Deltaproteobacteria bacterium]MBW2446313.1 acetyl-CoA acetyltransferase [Deltaproteobacteria bacterium]
MALAEDRSPVVIGVGQRIQKDVDPREGLDPIDLMEAAARAAAEDAGLDSKKLGELDRVIVPSIIGAHYSNAARLLCERIGVGSGAAVSLGVGGNGPQKALNEAARDVAAGRTQAVLVVGAEALDLRQRAQAAGIKLDWSGGGGLDTAAAEPAPSSDIEARHRLMLPPFVYPLYENALRVHHGRDLETHRQAVGAMLERFTETAADNPYAWFRTRRSADEITRPGPSNRMVAFPYTKFMNAILRVDQAAAVLLTSVEHARTLGVPADRMVHWLGGGDAVEDPWLVSERPDFHSSRAMAQAYDGAFREARLEPEDVHVFDLYSCFPSAVELGCDTLGIGIDDPRPLTVTGGLPYAGGPGNNYGTHGIAQLIRWLRATPGTVGMATGIGWYFTKHSAGLYGTLPRMELPERAAAVEPAATPAIEVAKEAEGPGRIETYTVAHDRDDEPEVGMVVGRLEDQRRFIAFVEGGRDALVSLETGEGIGRTGQVRRKGDTHRFRLDG